MQGVHAPQWFTWPTRVLNAQPGEQIILKARAHPFRLLIGTWPIALGLAALIALLYSQVAMAAPGAVWGGAEILISVVMLVLLVRWAISDVYHWWFTIYVISDQRIIHGFGGLTRHLEEIPLNKIQSTRAVIKSVVQWMLGIGTVEIAGTGGERILFENIAAPRQIEVQILEARDQIRSANQAQAPAVDDPALQQVLDALGQAEPVPAATPLPPEISQSWPLSRAVHIPLEHGEQQIGIISRHWWAFVEQEAIPISLLVAACLSAWITAQFAMTFLGPIALIIGLVGVAWGLLVYLNFADDIFLLTTRRIIDVDRHYFVLYETQIAIEYDKIQVVDLDVSSLWARLLGYGDVIVKSSASNPKDWIRMRKVPHPRQIGEAIERSRVALKKSGEIASTNKQKGDLKAWFSSVLTEMVTVAPDLRGQPLEAAIELAQRAGLRIIVMGESVAIAGMPAGLVISQSPQPGSRCLRGGEASVMLSRM